MIQRFNVNNFGDLYYSSFNNQINSTVLQCINLIAYTVIVTHVKAKKVEQTGTANYSIPEKTRQSFLKHQLPTQFIIRYINSPAFHIPWLV